MTTLATILLGVWALACALSDLLQRRVPNGLTGSALLVATAVCAITGATVLGSPWRSALLAAVVTAVALISLFALDLLGAGDVKLLVAMALLTGPVAIGSTLLLGSVLAGVWSAVSLYAGGRAPRGDTASVARGAHAPRATLPLAVPYGVAFVAMLWSLRETIS